MCLQRLQVKFATENPGASRDMLDQFADAKIAEWALEKRNARLGREVD